MFAKNQLVRGWNLITIQRQLQVERNWKIKKSSINSLQRNKKIVNIHPVCHEYSIKWPQQNLEKADKKATRWRGKGFREVNEICTEK